MYAARVMQGDDELLRAWSRGDTVAGTELFDRHYKALRRFFGNKVDLSEVEDLMQRSFLGCLEAIGRFRGDASFRTFLFSIARRQLYKHFRDTRVREGRRVDLSVMSVQSLGRSPSSLFNAQQEEAILLRALQRINVDYQTVLELHYWEQLSAGDIAEICEVAPVTARTRLHRARNALREQVEAQLRSPDRTIEGFDLEEIAARAKP